VTENNGDGEKAVLIRLCKPNRSLLRNQK